jgi:hypothetical protein
MIIHNYPAAMVVNQDGVPVAMPTAPTGMYAMLCMYIYIYMYFVYMNGRHTPLARVVSSCLLMRTNVVGFLS